MNWLRSYGVRVPHSPIHQLYMHHCHTKAADTRPIVLLAMVMRFFFKLSRRQCTLKITCVAILEQVMRWLQMKTMQKKNHIQWVEFFMNLVTCVATTVCRRRDNFQKDSITIARKNRLCSPGLTLFREWKEFEPRNACVITVRGCAETFPCTIKRGRSEKKKTTTTTTTRI